MSISGSCCGGLFYGKFLLWQCFETVIYTLVSPYTSSEGRSDKECWWNLKPVLGSLWEGGKTSNWATAIAARWVRIWENQLPQTPRSVQERDEVPHEPELRFPWSMWWRPQWGSCAPSAHRSPQWSRYPPADHGGPHTKPEGPEGAGGCRNEPVTPRAGAVASWRKEPLTKQVFWQDWWLHGAPRLVFPKDITLWKEPTLKRYMKNCSLWKDSRWYSSLKTASHGGTSCWSRGRRSGRHNVMNWPNPHSSSCWTSWGDEIEKISSKVEPGKKARVEERCFKI